MFWWVEVKSFLKWPGLTNWRESAGQGFPEEMTWKEEWQPHRHAHLADKVLFRGLRLHWRQTLSLMRGAFPSLIGVFLPQAINLQIALRKLSFSYCSIKTNTNKKALLYLSGFSIRNSDSFRIIISQAGLFASFSTRLLFLIQQPWALITHSYSSTTCLP